MENLDLISLSKIENTCCAIIGKDGVSYPEYKRVLIKIDMDDGKRKYIRITRQNKYYGDEINHVIESYVLEGEGVYTNTVGNRFKMYDKDKFEKRLKKIEKELSKTTYQIL